MAVEQKVVVEPAGESEASWSAAPRSSTGLPKFVEGDFRQVTEIGDGIAEGDGYAPEAPGVIDAEADWDEATDQVDDDIGAAAGPLLSASAAAELRIHMAALVEAGGRSRSRQAVRKIVNYLPGN